MKQLIHYRKYIYLTLGLIAIGGVFFPLITLNIDFFGNGTMIEISLLNLFQNIGNPSGQLSPNGMSQFGESNPIFSEIARTIIFPFLAYLLMMLLIIISTIFSIFDKFKVTTNVIFISVLAIAIYIGFAFTGIPTLLGQSLAEAFESNPFISSIDLSNLFNVNLRSGYWQTILSIATLLPLKYIIEKYQKNIVRN